MVLVHTLGGIWRHDGDLRRRAPVLVPTDQSAVERIALSPDATWVAAAVRGSRVVVADIGDGRVLRSLDGPGLAVALGAISATQLVYQRECRMFVVEVRGTDEPKAFGPELCTPLSFRGFRDGAVWLRAGMPIAGFAGLVTIDPTSGAAEWLLEGHDRGLLDVAVARAGARFCWLQRAGAGAELWCADAPRQAPWLVAEGAGRISALSRDGERLVYLTGPEGHVDVVLVDFPTMTARRIASDSQYEWWTFLPGARRLVGHGAQNRAVLIDVAEGWTAHLGGRREEWEDVDTFPDDADRFFIRKDSSPPRLQYVDLRPE